MNVSSDEPDDQLTVAFSAKNEIEASAIVQALTAAGIKAMMQGQHTGSFRAENWTDVLVVVREKDRDAAQAVLSQIKQAANVDWEQVDVGKPED